MRAIASSLDRSILSERISAGPRSDHSRKLLVVLIGGLIISTVVARRLGYRLGGRTVVRCRQGHLFSSLWIPGVKLKGLDLGIARLQHCPVGNHWSVVVPVREANLTADDRRSASEHRDIRLP